MSGARNTSFLANNYNEVVAHIRQRGVPFFWRGALLNSIRLFTLSYLQLYLYDTFEEVLPFQRINKE